VLGYVANNKVETAQAIHGGVVATTVGVLEGDRGAVSDAISGLTQLASGSAVARRLTARVPVSPGPKAVTVAESSSSIDPALDRRLGLLAENDFGPVNQLPRNETGSVQVLDVGTFGELDRLKVVGDRITPDHQPSAAAIIANREAIEGRALTAAEKRQVYREGTALALPEDIHRTASRSFAGRNTSSQIQGDSVNLPRGAGLDQAALRDRLVEAGYDVDAVDAAFRLRDRLNEKPSD